ncbi:methyltransferase [Candidatus Micrarchaeota archaeon]|nr:methyltransferase [Candidatus Micrarchaeota archaeon]
MIFTYKGLTLSIPESVYPPAEDSFMLAEAAKNLYGDILEVGCGSGLVSLICAKNGKSKVLGVDINPDAPFCSSVNAKSNGVTNIKFLKSDLFGSLKGKKFDYILFNPPYLPTEEKEKLSGEINYAYDGGKDGRVVLDRFLKDFDKSLKPKGVLFLIQSSLNNLEKTKQMLKKKGFVVEIISEEKFFFEKLYLLKAFRKAKLPEP